MQRMLENTPHALIGDLRYAAEKSVRDKAWDDWRERTGRRLAISPEMDQLVAEGYFEKARSGDLRGASYFARLVAFRMNPVGNVTAVGCLRKGGGSNVEGYADDAVCGNGNQADLFNVFDLVGGSGAPGANPTWNGPLPRRSSDTWEAPRQLTQTQMEYLKPGGGVVHPPPPPPPPPPPQFTLPGRERAMNFGKRIDGYYASQEGLQRTPTMYGSEVVGGGMSINGRPDWEGIGTWLFEKWLEQAVAGKSDDEIFANIVKDIRQSREWRERHPGEIP